jgi:hypothetical protein
MESAQMGISRAHFRAGGYDGLKPGPGWLQHSARADRAARTAYLMEGAGLNLAPIASAGLRKQQSDFSIPTI